MVGFFVRAGKAYKALKEEAKAIKSFNPKTSDLGGKTVSQAKMDAAIAKIKSESFNYKEGIKKAIKKMKDIKSK